MESHKHSKKVVYQMPPIEGILKEFMEFAETQWEDCGPFRTMIAKAVVQKRKLAR